MGAQGGDSDLYGYCVDDPVNRLDAWGLEVQVCKRPVDVDNDFVRNVVDHYFIKTDSTESGMGIPGRAANQGDSINDLFAKTQWVDHSGQSKRPGTKCWTVPNVDEQCVDALIRPGNDTGRWIPGINDCHTNPTDVLDYCRTDLK